MLTDNSIFLLLVQQFQGEFIYAVVGGVLLFMLGRIRA